MPREMVGDEEVYKVDDGFRPWVSSADSLLLMADNIIVTERCGIFYGELKQGRG